MPGTSARNSQESVWRVALVREVSDQKKCTDRSPASYLSWPGAHHLEGMKINSYDLHWPSSTGHYDLSTVVTLLTRFALLPSGNSKSIRTKVKRIIKITPDVSTSLAGQWHPTVAHSIDTSLAFTWHASSVLFKNLLLTLGTRQIVVAISVIKFDRWVVSR